MNFPQSWIWKEKPTEINRKNERVYEKAMHTRRNIQQITKNILPISYLGCDEN